jgi:hypothetical protein
VVKKSVTLLLEVRKTIFTHIFLVNPGVIILIKKMLNIFSKLKRNNIYIIIYFIILFIRFGLTM